MCVASTNMCSEQCVHGQVYRVRMVSADCECTSCCTDEEEADKEGNEAKAKRDGPKIRASLDKCHKYIDASFRVRYFEQSTKFFV